MFRRGRYPELDDLLVTLKAPVMSACEAITVARVARPTSGTKAQSGAIMKGF